MGVRKVQCEADCLECVEALRDDQFVQHVHASEFADVHQLLDRDWETRLRHIPQEANALHISTQSVSPQCVFTILEDPPNRVVPLIFKDTIGV